ncbi:MAG: sulfotransferase [Symploca sp. SIO2E9]|nr:sulfotransferase [Symploca sp. SIO2E9]
MSNQKLLIHIGYPKAASTWLQNTLFNDEKTGFISPWGALSSEGLNMLALVNSFRFSAQLTRKRFEPGLQEAARRDLVPVISHESLSGNQMQAKYWGKEVADRIYAVFPEARVLIIIREQKSIILSSYKQYIRSGQSKTIQRFIGVDVERPGFKPICRLDYFEYDLLITYYQNIFGSHNVLVLPFELLKKKPQYFWEKIKIFAGSKGTFNPCKTAEYTSLKAGTVACLQQLNRFIVTPDFSGSKMPFTYYLIDKLSKVVELITPADFHQNIETNWRQVIADYIGESFSESNQITSKLIDMNLADFGYDC